MTGISISIWGAHAERFVARHASAFLAAVFPRSLHLESAGDFLCIGDASIGCGPLNAVLDTNDWMRLARSVPPVATSVSVDHGAIRIGGMTVVTLNANPWLPSPWPPVPPGERLAQALARFMNLARDRAPTDGLARVVMSASGHLDGCLDDDREGGCRAPLGNVANASGSALERMARPRVERLRRWVTGRLAATPDLAPPVDLLGLGPGLTPSGDDLLCGALVALHAVGHPEAARELYAGLAKATSAATSPLSGAFLRAAGDGLALEALHAAIVALLDGQPELSQHVAALSRVGHTSGWDAMAGAVLALQAFSTIAVQRAGVARPRISL